MNLHIVSDNKFINSFYKNLQELGILDNNKLVIRSNRKTLLFVDQPVPHASLETPEFEELTGDTSLYDCVYIHLFSPLMYRWAARHQFRKVSWLVWGADIYDLPFIGYELNEPLTLRKFMNRSPNLQELLLKIKTAYMNLFYKKRAMRKVTEILTWMDSEFAFIKSHMPVPHASRVNFYYENDVPFHKLTEVVHPVKSHGGPLRIIIGNSASPMLNHLDAVTRLVQSGVYADIILPLSYGDPAYVEFLRKELAGYSNGSVEFVTRFMAFDEYVNFLMSADLLLMNNIRPQGYGNVFMMMYLGKPVFMNEKNISIPDLEASGIHPARWEDIPHARTFSRQSNKAGITSLFTHEKLLKIYRSLFARTKP